MNEHFFRIEKTARYFTIGEATPSVKHLWFVLHGYGQLAEYFIRNFRGIASQDRLVVAPEGFHKFYLEGTGGRVGANWMTRENRLRDISDYTMYLNQLYQSLRTELSPNVKVHIFGFSQGVATAMRWANVFEGERLTSLHNWAGTFPPDIDYLLNREKFNEVHLTSSFGDEDEYISPEMADQLAEQLTSQDIQVSVQHYRGKHKIYQTPLLELVERAELV